MPHRAAKQVRIDPMLRGFEVDDVNGAIHLLLDALDFGKLRPRPDELTPLMKPSCRRCPDYRSVIPGKKSKLTSLTATALPNQRETPPRAMTGVARAITV